MADVLSLPRPPELSDLVAANIRRIRAQRGLSLEKVGRASGVSRAMICQIELGRSVPTINVLWKLALALEVSLLELTSREPDRAVMVLRASSAKVTTTPAGTVRSRALTPPSERRCPEMRELRVNPRAVEEAPAEPPGTLENFVVSRGAIEVQVGSTTHSLTTGDAALLEADVPRFYRNRTQNEALLYVVTTYAPSRSLLTTSR